MYAHNSSAAARSWCHSWKQKKDDSVCPVRPNIHDISSCCFTSWKFPHSNLCVTRHLLPLYLTTISLYLTTISLYLTTISLYLTTISTLPLSLFTTILFTTISLTLPVYLLSTFYIHHRLLSWNNTFREWALQSPQLVSCIPPFLHRVVISTCSFRSHRWTYSVIGPATQANLLLSCACPATSSIIPKEVQPKLVRVLNSGCARLCNFILHEGTVNTKVEHYKYITRDLR